MSGRLPLIMGAAVAALVLAADKQETPRTAAEPPAERPKLTLRMAPTQNLETLKYIASITEPTTREIRQGEDVVAIIRETYGYYNETIAQLVKQYNPGLTLPRSATARVLVLPGSPYWKFGVSLRVPRGATATDIAEQLIGRTGPRTRSRMRVAGEVIHLEYVSPYVTLTLRPGLELESKEIARRLAARASEVEIGAAQLVPNYGLQAITPGGASNWWDVFKAPRSQVALGELPFRNTAIVAILDTGIPPDDNRFPFWQNVDELNGEADVDDDGNRYEDDVIGWDFVLAGFPAEDMTLETLFNHGTHVAGIASARMLEPAIRKPIDDRIRLMILKIADRTGNVSASAIGNSIIYARRKRAIVVNMSFADKYDDSWYEQMLGTRYELLFVVASGNGSRGRGLNLDESEVYPARLGGASHDNVITVAAHDANGQLTDFSNFGRTTVDLAAPGTNVESTIIGGTRSLTGTSQATPWVSLTAALLYSAGITTPREIKHRIIATTDFDPALRDRLWSGGRLDILRALTLDRDVVRLSSGEIVAGRVVAPASVAGVPLSRMRQLVLKYSDDARKRTRVMTVQTGRIVYQYGPAVTGSIQIDLASGEKRSLAADGVEDISFALAR